MRIKMKKIFLSLIILFAANCAFAYQSFFGFSVGLASGIPFYGSAYVNDCNKSMSDPSRIIVGTLASANFNVSDNATFFIGSDLICDFIWKGSQYSNHLNYDFSLGIKVFPNLAGFCAGLAYVLGARTDFVETDEVSKFSDTSAWGNGIKVLAEYNGAHDGKSRYYPTLGMYWKILPRGEHTYDNSICAYIMANL